MSLLIAVEDWIVDRGHEVDVEQEDLNRALDLGGANPVTEAAVLWAMEFNRL